jgi:hypothetical protein
MKNYWKVGDYGKQLRWELPSLYFRVAEIEHIKSFSKGPLTYTILVDEVGSPHPSYMCEKTTEDKYLIGQY